MRFLCGKTGKIAECGNSNSNNDSKHTSNNTSNKSYMIANSA